jgi:hypothetical protein
MTSELEYVSAQEHAADLRRSADRARLARSTDPVDSTARRGGLIARIVSILLRGDGHAEAGCPAEPGPPAPRPGARQPVRPRPLPSVPPGGCAEEQAALPGTSCVS